MRDVGASGGRPGTAPQSTRVHPAAFGHPQGSEEEATRLSWTVPTDPIDAPIRPEPVFRAPVEKR
ncbi:hypothetical protein GCM10009799_31770 [Nocardiopsis rhodophaea]|uniref:Uncharacterized protein n=1 Tax=Nocardiopsis rhodophaea TaxID=280238 RepID=A0ABN2TAA1_9ACTN